MLSINLLKKHLEKLTGEPAPIVHSDLNSVITNLNKKFRIDYTHLNEILLLFGYDRITNNFFQFLYNGKYDYSNKSIFNNIKIFIKGIEGFERLSILLFGNVKYGFKNLSSDRENLKKAMEYLQPRAISSFKSRSKPIHPIIPIDKYETYCVGEFMAKKIFREAKDNPTDKEKQAEAELCKQVQIRGKKNFYAYLISDHLDVYVATSMRERHEYVAVNKITNKIFSDSRLKQLRLRYFDPTQATCSERIDKGLSEALMLKRAKCTIYLAQESDTLGKDSELASTLAQGKPVIAYIPNGTLEFLEDLLSDLKIMFPKKSVLELLLDQLKVYSPGLAWSESTVLAWLQEKKTESIPDVKSKLLQVIQAHYDERASKLSNHPLGIQVHLNDGVANGVLIVRDINQCIRLLKSVIIGNMKFKVIPKKINGNKYLLLQEKISKSIFRVVSGDKILTNAFWNFYLNPIE